MDAIQHNIQHCFFTRAFACLVERDVDNKIVQVNQLATDLKNNKLGIQPTLTIQSIDLPGRPERPILVDPKSVPKRTLVSEQGRAAFIHALAHIEFNAINLALDAVYRFQSMPVDYYSDWMRVAKEEAYHFSLLRQRLYEMGFAYGDFDAHNGLWEMAVKTAHDVLVRMALVPRVLEARGLDVTPRMIIKLTNIGDIKSAEILKVIYIDEITHVAIGSHWFQYVCEQRNLDPDNTFQVLLEEYLTKELRGPFDFSARRKAGFSTKELNYISGHNAVDYDKFKSANESFVYKR